MPVKMVKVSVYINEADEWQHCPLHLEILNMLQKHGVAGGTVLRAVAGFTGHGGMHTTSLVDAGGKMPLVVEFIDTAENVERVMPILKSMTGQRLIARQQIETVSRENQ